MSLLSHQTQVNPSRNFWDTSEQANSGIALVYSGSDIGSSFTFNAGASFTIYSFSYTPAISGKVLVYAVLNINNPSILQFDVTASVNFNGTSACVSATQLPAKALVGDDTVRKCLTLVGTLPVVGGTTYTVNYAFSNNLSAGTSTYGGASLMILFSP